MRAAYVFPTILSFAAAMIQPSARAQAAVGASQTYPLTAAGTHETPTLTVAPTNEPYRPPTQNQRFRRYVRWMFAPYSLASVTFVSGIHQAEHNPPDWTEGWDGFGQRFASDLGTEMAGATARYALAEALREDTAYYPCACRGFGPRLGHALTATFIARRGADGHGAFGLPELVAPYAGSFTSVYGWYPSRYGWKDALRMGDNGLLSEAGTNVAIEFLPSILNRWGRKWKRRLHLGIPSGARRLD